MVLGLKWPIWISFGVQCLSRGKWRGGNSFFLFFFFFLKKKKKKEEEMIGAHLLNTVPCWPNSTGQSRSQWTLPLNLTLVLVKHQLICYICCSRKSLILPFPFYFYFYFCYYTWNFMIEVRSNLKNA